MDLSNLKSVREEQEIEPNIFRTVIHLDNLMTAVVRFVGGAMTEPQPPHQHPHEQITYVAKGNLLFFVEGKKHQLTVGDTIKVPSNLNHTVQTLSDEVILVDAFTPLRKEFINTQNPVAQIS